MPIWACWVRAMSPPSVLMAGSEAWLWAIMPISTAWAWWDDMSRAKPASAECSPGSVSRGVSHPAAYPTSTHTTTAATPTYDLGAAGR